MISNKLSSGSVSASKIKKEKDDYQAEVEAHFEQTSKKFKQMTAQYQDLYQHMSVGATTLCRPENITPGLTDQTDLLASKRQSSKPQSTKPEAAKTAPTKSEPTQQTSSKKKDPEKNKTPASKKSDGSEPLKSNRTNAAHIAKSGQSSTVKKATSKNS
jgi:uncharacterized membrane-anchored protein YhcB (DUF1043 family)